VARLWAPGAAAVSVDVRPVGGPERSVRAAAVEGGRWIAELGPLQHGDRYLVTVDGRAVADPWARWFPDGIERWPAYVDLAAIGATPPGIAARPPRPELDLRSAVLYELHVGTFSPEGDLRGVERHLDHLVDLGVTHLELLPIAAFPGDRGWGYDGIFWSAVHHAYGGPEAMVALVDRAHERGLGVILDVVFNHIGPTGDRSYDAFGPFFTDRHRTPWGSAINVDGPLSDPVRETIFQAATWWVDEVGVDGLRVDACHAIVDQSANHVLAELVARVRAVHPGALMIAESGLNDPATVREPALGGWGFDADWADDFHHAVRTVLTEDRTAWLGDFGSVAQLAKAFRRPYVHDGTWSAYRQRRFGAPADDVAPERFVVFSQNHDQVGNRPFGDRLPPDVRPLAAMLTLLSPFTPMLFMGEELDEDAPFQFFTDHRDPFIADATRDGRRSEFADWMVATGEEVPDPQARSTFERSKLSWRDDDRARSALDLHRRLIATRAHLPDVEPTVTADETARWLRVDRGRFALLANLAPRPTEVPCPAGSVVVASDPSTPRAVRSGALALGALAGALVHLDALPEGAAT
jgi:maltooligosyltrehalose trehalohydrolase